MTDKSLTRDAALMWLNDRLGRIVTADVQVELGGYSASLLQASGRLRHWREADEESSRASNLAGLARADIEGQYYVGDSEDSAALDLSDLPDNVTINCRELPLLPSYEAQGALPASELRIVLSANAWLSIVEPIRRPDRAVKAET